MATLLPVPELVAFDATGAQITGRLGVRVISVAGPATYSTGGILLDASATFSRILGVMGMRQYATASPGTVIGFASMSVMDNGNFATGKARLLLGRTVSTPLGTVAAPTITTVTNVAPVAVGTAGGALAQVAGATGITGVQAPAFTGTAAASIPTELANGATTPNGMTYEVVLLGVLL